MLFGPVSVYLEDGHLISECVCVRLYAAADVDDDNASMSVCDMIDFLELFPNCNLRRFDTLTVITLCHRTTVEKNLEQETAHEGLLVDVCIVYLKKCIT